MEAYWVWMVRDGKRVLPVTPFDTEAEAVEWMKFQTPPAGMTYAVHYDRVD